MKCPECSHENRPDARYCLHCGKALSVAHSQSPLIPPAPGIIPPHDLPAAVLASGAAGEVQIANYRLTIGEVHGGVVNVTLPGVGARARRTPIYVRPRPLTGFLDREETVELARKAFRTIKPLEVRGDGGIGKTALLRHLAYLEEEGLFPDGVVHVPVRRKGYGDVLQELYDAFYVREGGYKPTEAEIRRELGGKRALVLLDDVCLGREDVESLLGVAPGCTFVVTGDERRLWGEGESIPLAGLPPEASLDLLEQELGRELIDEERAAAGKLCAALGGHPLHILQAAAEVREDEGSFEEIAGRLDTIDHQGALESLAGLSEDERRVLTILLALDGVPIGREHISTLAGLQDAAPLLEHLELRHLIQAHSPVYSIAAKLAVAPGEEQILEDWRTHALRYFVGWAAANRGDLARLSTSTEAMMALLEWGASAGNWREVWQLGQLIEGMLALAGQWAAWGQVLAWLLAAGRALAEQSLEGWALHQLGTRALCLGDKGSARAALSQALHLRGILGDRPGAAVTQHNLNVLLGGPPPSRGRGPRARPSARKGLPTMAKVILLLFVVGFVVASALGAWLLWRWLSSQGPPEPPVVPLEPIDPGERPVDPGGDPVDPIEQDPGDPDGGPPNEPSLLWGDLDVFLAFHGEKRLQVWSPWT